MPVLDTNLLIRLGRGDPAASAAIDQLAKQPLLVPAQAAAEFLVGVEEPHRALAWLHSSFAVRHTDDAHILAVHELWRTMGPRPTGLRWGDVHIAAVAHREGTFVVTANKRHFRQLGVPAWHFDSEPHPPEPNQGEAP